MKTIALPKIAGRRVAAAAFALCLAPGLAPAFATGAQAAEGNEGRWYFGLNVPVMFIDNTKTDVSGSMTLPLGTGTYTTKAVSHYGLGFRVGGTVGYYVIPNLRLEGEVFYGFARVKKSVHSGTRVVALGNTIPIPGKVTAKIKGNAKMLGAVVNAWYDIPLDSEWIPYVGGGVGVFHADFSGLKWNTDLIAQRFAAPLVCSGVGGAPDLGTPECAGALAGIKGARPADKDTVFAFQVGGGVAYKVSDETSVHLSYKYQMAPGLQFDGKTGGTTIKTKSAMRIHLFEIGFRYLF